MTDFQMPLLFAILIMAGLDGLVAVIARKKAGLAKLMYVFAGASVVVSIALLVIRGRLAHGLPLANGLDFSLWLVLVLNLFILFLIKRARLFMAAFCLDLIVAGLTIWMMSLDLTVSPLMPALRSPWLSVHVLTAMLSYSCLCVSFVLSLLLLVKSNGLTLPGQATKELKELDYWSYRLVMIGLPLLTVMLITGSIWAEYSWGSYWSWDWKETWALITWLVYALYLHLRVSGWRYKKAAILNIIGFAVVVFTFFGVSYLLPGLHSYLQT